MPIKFYTDTHIAKAITTQCRQRGVGIIRCEDVGLAEASDEEPLSYATGQNRVMVTSDADFIRLHNYYLEMGKVYAGIIYILPDQKDDLGGIIRFVTDLHEFIEGGAATLDEDVNNQLFWL